MVIDGAMGTAIQRDRPDEAGYRGDRFTEWPSALQGNNDLLTLSQPGAIEDIHFAYAMAGADILETNTFSSTSIAQADYGMQEFVYELNRDGARLARRAAIKAERADGRRRFVAGALGPTNRTASLSPDVNDPGFRNISYDELVGAYTEATRALIEGGVYLILVETIFDSLNAKAALGSGDRLTAAMTEQAFQKYLAVLLVALLALFPGVSATTFGYVTLAALAGSQPSPPDPT